MTFFCILDVWDLFLLRREINPLSLQMANLFRFMNLPSVFRTAIWAVSYDSIATSKIISRRLFLSSVIIN